MTQQSTIEKTKTVQEIQTQIEATQENLITDKEVLEGLRADRAKLAVENSTKNSTKIALLDKQITTLRDKIDNTPAVISELENQLAAEQERLAQAEAAILLEKQNEVADEVEVLSKNFIALLKKANDVNEHLLAALTAEAGLAQKTGQQVLGDYCQGSRGSLSMLLETMQAQLAGQHTNIVGPGLVPSGVPIRL